MVESFKITANKLKRILKISIYLPKGYHSSDKEYPLLLAFDGQLLFNFLNEQTMEMDMTSILDSLNKEVICISLQAPKIEEWRISELNPYYNGNNNAVDTSLSEIFFEYVIYDLLPLLKQRYRINAQKYILGFGASAIAALYMVYKYPLFDGAGLFSPDLINCNENVFIDIENNFNPQKPIFLYHGSKDTDTKFDNLYYKLFTMFQKLECEDFKSAYESYLGNSSEAWNIHLADFIKFIIPNINN